MTFCLKEEMDSSKDVNIVNMITKCDFKIITMENPTEAINTLKSFMENAITIFLE